jgi:hypothetical protein
VPNSTKISRSSDRARDADAVSGGLYTRIVPRDFLPEYPGRPAFVPGLSEYGATKPWAGSPMASVQRAVTMLRKLNLHGVSRDIRKALRGLQDIYSEPINLADESSDDDTNADGTEHSHESESEHVRGDRDQSYHVKDTSKPPQAGFEDRLAPKVGRPTGGRDNRNASVLEAELAGEEAKDHNKSTNSPFSQSDVCLTPQSLAMQVSSGRRRRGWNRHWRWGPGATSHDAVNFYKRVL